MPHLPAGQNRVIRRSAAGSPAARAALFDQSWFVLNPARRAASAALHPAKFPEELAAAFISFFTPAARPSVVIDPFCGTGSTLAAVDALNAAGGPPRRGFGVELNPRYAGTARGRTAQAVSCGDAACYPLDAVPPVDLIFTSPPYWNVLSKKTGYLNARRAAAGLDVVYSDSSDDLGNIDDYDVFIGRTARVCARWASKLVPGGYCVVVLGCTNSGGRFYPIPYDFAAAFVAAAPGVRWCGERIWCQDNKPLTPYGYPYSFVSSIVHHTCLVFRTGSSGLSA